ncbi:hypothetical protein HDU88_002354 [Geranomyces variabilis]|nr:hypothetical protein HDU88_002354 [Geranomyces variabilis]
MPAYCGNPLTGVYVRLSTPALNALTAEGLDAYLPPIEGLHHVVKRGANFSAHLHFRSAYDAAVFAQAHLNESLVVNGDAVKIGPSRYDDGTDVVYPAQVPADQGVAPAATSLTHQMRVEDTGPQLSSRETLDVEVEHHQTVTITADKGALFSALLHFRSVYHAAVFAKEHLGKSFFINGDTVRVGSSRNDDGTDVIYPDPATLNPAAARQRPAPAGPPAGRVPAAGVTTTHPMGVQDHGDIFVITIDAPRLRMETVETEVEHHRTVLIKGEVEPRQAGKYADSSSVVLPLPAEVSDYDEEGMLAIELLKEVLPRKKLAAAAITSIHPMHVEDRGEFFVVTIHAPGIKIETLETEVKRRKTVRVTAEVEATQPADNLIFSNEALMLSVVLALPSMVDDDGAEFEFRDGCVVVEFPKAEPPRKKVRLMPKVSDEEGASFSYEEGVLEIELRKEVSPRKKLRMTPKARQ